jgi:ribosomal protein L9
MLDLKAVVQDPEGFERRLARRGQEAAALLQPVKTLAAERRTLNVALEDMKMRQAEANARVGQLMRTDRAAGEKARGEARALGDEVKVKDGFARNYLLPNKLAVVASSSAIKMADIQSAADKNRHVREAEEVDALIEKINGKVLKFKAKAGGKDRIHGSITAANIADELSSQIGQEVDKKKVIIGEPLKQIGEHEVALSFGKAKEAKIKVLIEEE